MRHYVILTVVIFGGLWSVDLYKFDGRNSQAARQTAWHMPGYLLAAGWLFRAKFYGSSAAPAKHGHVRSLISLCGNTYGRRCYPVFRKIIGRALAAGQQLQQLGEVNRQPPRREEKMLSCLPDGQIFMSGCSTMSNLPSSS